MSNINNLIKKYIAGSYGFNPLVDLPTDKIIEIYEKKLNFNFPLEYRFFLLTSSTALHSNHDICFFLLDEKNKSSFEIVKNSVIAYEQGVPREWLPIGEENGDYFCLDKEGRVHFWSHNGPTDESWDSVADWIEQELLREDNNFDDEYEK